MKELCRKVLGLVVAGLAVMVAAQGEENSAIARRVEMAASPAEGAAIATDHVRLVKSALAARSGQELSVLQITAAAENLREAHVALASAIKGLNQTDTISTAEAERLLKAIALDNYNAEEAQEIPFFLTENVPNAAEKKALEDEAEKGRVAREQLRKEITAIGEKTFAVPQGTPARVQWSEKLPTIVIHPPKPVKSAGLSPLEAYKRQVGDMVGKYWHKEMRTNFATNIKNPETGRVEISVTIAPDGSVRNLKTVRNTSDAVFLGLCIKSIRNAPIPPIPKELVAILPDGKLEYSFTFDFK